MKTIRLGAMVAFFWCMPLFAANPTPELVIYTYDSLVAKGGLGEKLFPLFEQQCHCRIKVVAVGDSGQMIARLQLEARRKAPVAHVVLGVDEMTSRLILPLVETNPGPIPQLSHVPKTLYQDNGFVPFDYGHLTFMMDTQELATRKLPVPRTMMELMGETWKRQLIIEDPRTSSPGLRFVLYLKALSGKQFEKNVTAFKTQWLTLTPGWDAAYNLFLKREAPLVWSYISSQAYHEEHGDKPTAQTPRRYVAFSPPEGLPIQVEGAVMVRDSTLDAATRRRALQFMDFLVSAEAQALIPTRNWMLPVRKDVPLPESFKNLPAVQKTITITDNQTAIDDVLKLWLKQVM